MTREEFLIARLAHYINQGCDLFSAKVNAAFDVAQHFPLTELTQSEVQADHDDDAEGLCS